MFVMTMTKRRLVRAIMFILVLITGIAIGVFAIMSSIDTGAEGLKLPIYSVGRADNKISITFDCAWANSNTDELISILAKENVKATFFVTGEFCDKYPDDVKKLYNAGHEIQNHSDKHPHVKGMNLNELIEDTKSCSKKIEMLTGEKPTLYRSPYGEYDDKLITTIEGIGMYCIQWNMDSIDWNKPSPETIIERTTKNVSSGSILLFHNDLENTTKALPEVIKKLKEQGFEPCKVSELIYKENYTVDGTGKQCEVEKVTDAMVFSDNSTVNEAFDILSDNLTVSDIEGFMNNGVTAELMQKLMSLLTSEQIAAIQTLDEAELEAAFVKLKDAVYERETPIVVESQPEEEPPVPEQPIVTDKDGTLVVPEEA